MIPILYLILSCLLLWVLIAGRGSWLLKAVFIIPCVWFTIAIGVSLPSMLGWPSKAELPEKYEVFWAIVENPNLTNGDPGRILVWAKNFSDSDDDSMLNLYSTNYKQPRVHELPYSKEMHKQAQMAKNLIKGGQRVMGTNKKSGKQGMKGAGGGKGKGNGKGNSKGRGRPGHAKGMNGTTGGGEQSDDSVGPKFYILPPVELPEKT